MSASWVSTSPEVSHPMALLGADSIGSQGIASITYWQMFVTSAASKSILPK